MGQKGFGKWVVALVLCVIIAGGYYVGYRSVHAGGTGSKTHRSAVAKRPVVKIDKAKVLRTKLQVAWQQALAKAPPDGNVDVALYDNATGATARYSVGAGPFITASIVKLTILETLLWHDQQQGLSGLTTSQLAEARPMIANSNNDAATDLWQLDGGPTAINAFFERIGTTGSTASPDWGLTQTTAIDQLKVLNEVAYRGKLLTAASAKQASELMDQVETDQRWGVSGGVPAGVSVQLKNGWLPYGSGWNVNSIGHVHGSGVDYTIAVLTNGDKTMQSGIHTIQALSTAAWQIVSTTKF